MRGWLALLAIVSLAAFGASSCGGDDNGGSSKAGSGGCGGGGSVVKDAGSTGASDASNDGSNTCAPGEKSCSGKCVSTSDPANGCGSPDCTACGSAHGQASCGAGACKIACDSGFGDCDGDA